MLALRRQQALDAAAAMFVISDWTTPHYPAALQVIARAGADPEHARALRENQGAGFTVREV